MAEPRVQVTQQYVAKVAGVSQATVSMVLSGRGSAAGRISPQTRQRVMHALRSTGYIASITARRRPESHRVMGVFTSFETYPVLPHHPGYPFVLGIAGYAQQHGCDVLLLTGTPMVDGRRRLLGDGSRPVRADGCILLGDPHRSDVTQVRGEGRPVVCVGHRDDLHGEIPYVDGDYESAATALVEHAADLGHRSAAYVGAATAGERYFRQLRGFTTGARARSMSHLQVDGTGLQTRDILESLVGSGVTVAFTERHSDSVALAQCAAESGMTVPLDLSLVALEAPAPVISSSETAPAFSGFTVPYLELGWQAADLLDALLAGSDDVGPLLLPCTVDLGRSLMTRPRSTRGGP